MKLVLIASFVIAALTTAHAQTTSPETQSSRRTKMADLSPEQRAERQTKKMKEQLSLSADQEMAIAAINLKYAQQMQPIINAGEQHNRNTRTQIRELMSRKDEELKNVLNDNQRTQYEALKEARKDKMRQKREQ